MKWRGKIIDRAEEPFKIGAIEGLQYNALDCCVPEHPQRHGKIYTPLEARQLSFGPDCRCDLLPYNSRWGSELPAYSEPIVNKRNRVKKEYESFFNKSDIESLISLEKMYRQDLGWHWAELRDYAGKFIKAGDSEHALTWINSSINERMKQQGCNKTVEQFDSSLASLYSLKGIIYLKSNNYIAALREFLISLWQYQWTPTKTLATQINRTLQRGKIEQEFLNEAIGIAKEEGIQKGLAHLES